jgi:hypothetical protein
MSCFIVSIAASWQSATISAPEQPSVCGSLSVSNAGIASGTHERSDGGHVDVRRDAHGPHPDAEDLLAPCRVRRPDVQEPVEAAGAHQRRVLVDCRQRCGHSDGHDPAHKGFGPVRRGDDGDARAQLLDAVHLREQAGEHALGRARGGVRASARERVDLVEEEHARRRAARLAEELAHRALRVADVLAEQLRRVSTPRTAQRRRSARASGPLMDTKLTALSCASARTSCVLLQPGGP